MKADDRIAGLLRRTPDLLTTILAAWRTGAVYQPLFAAFGLKAIEHRLTSSGAKIIVHLGDTAAKRMRHTFSKRLVFARVRAAVSGANN